jgi:competence protein ComEA
LVSTEKAANGWVIVAVLLVVVIIAGGVVIWSKYRPGTAIEISLPSAQPRPGEIYIGGEVNNPGIYPLYADDDIAGLIAAAGGITGDADGENLELIVPGSGEVASSQLININLAEAWLLEMLPGIGAVKAQAIIEYRERNGPFRNIQELSEVDGIGESTLEQIEHLITVAE